MASLAKTEIYTHLTILYSCLQRSVLEYRYTAFGLKMTTGLRERPLRRTLVLALVCLNSLPLICIAQEGQSSPSSLATAKSVGTVKALSGKTITLTTDAGSTIDIVTEDSTRLVRIVPGQKDLKNAVPIQFQDLQVGDRILARGESSDDGKSLTASSIVIMKESDVAAKQERDREDWQKRGVGGLVSKVDAAGEVITISTASFGDTKPVAIHLSKSTIFRRYSPDSVKFDDAKPGTVDQIKVGDQLRARGVRSPDGNELAAEEIVSGTFRNIAGTVASVDAANNTISVLDLATRKPTTLRIGVDSQLRVLPPTIAQRVAARLRGDSGGTSNTGAVHSGNTSEAPSAVATSPNSNGRPVRPGGPSDFQQMLKRLPAVSLADFKKGDAVMIVATEGSPSTQPTAITLLSGVEAILSASPGSGRAAMLLSPWNLGGGEAAAAAQ